VLSRIAEFPPGVKVADDPLDKLAREIKARKPPPKTAKATRTMSLAEPDFTIFAAYCRYKGIPHSEMLDHLIKIFLERVKDDIPPDLLPKK
jgi:hypothetical protein